MKRKSLQFVIRTCILLITILNTNLKAFNQVGQTEGFAKFQVDFISAIHDDSFRGFTLTEKDIAGSPYLSNEFIFGLVMTNDNVTYAGIPLRYNIFNDEMEFKISDDTILSITNPEIIKEIKFGDESFIYHKVNNKKGGYYSLRCTGKVQLLAKYKIIFNPAKEPEPYKEATPPTFSKKSTTYCIKLEDADPVLINNNKDIENAFGKESDEILGIIKKNKLNVKKEKDLIQLVQMINQK